MKQLQRLSDGKLTIILYQGDSGPVIRMEKKGMNKKEGHTRADRLELQEPEFYECASLINAAIQVFTTPETAALTPNYTPFSIQDAGWLTCSIRKLSTKGGVYFSVEIKHRYTLTPTGRQKVNRIVMSCAETKKMYRLLIDMSNLQDSTSNGGVSYTKEIDNLEECFSE